MSSTRMSTEALFVEANILKLPHHYQNWNETHFDINELE